MVFQGDPEPYTPGEKIEGITDDLARSLPPDYPRLTFVDVSAEIYNNMRAEFATVDGRKSTHFTDVADLNGLGQIALDYVGLGTAFADFDNDGDPDAFAGGKAAVREVGAGSSYCSQNAVGEELFGLGSSERVDTLTVVWPNGATQRLVDLDVDRIVVVTEEQQDGAVRGSGCGP